MTGIRTGGMYAGRPKRLENLPLGWFSAEAGPEGPDQKISAGSADDRMKFSYLAVFPPGNAVTGKTVGDEPPMTACGGNLIGGEISRNKQSPKELRRLRLRIWGRIAPNVSS